MARTLTFTNFADSIRGNHCRAQMLFGATTTLGRGWVRSGMLRETMAKATDAQMGVFADRCNTLYALVKSGARDPDLTAKRLQEIIGDSGLRYPKVNKGTLVHGLFTPPQQQIEIVKYFNDLHKWGFTDEDFASLGEPPFWPDDRLTAVVLMPSWGDLRHGLGLLWVAARSQFYTWSKGEDVRLDSIRCRMGHSVHRFGLRWLVLDLGANRVDPDNKESPWRTPYTSDAHSIGQEGLAAILCHPEWVRQMSREDVPFIALTALEIIYHEEGVPFLGYYYSSRRLYWGNTREGNGHHRGLFACPEVISQT